MTSSLGFCFASAKTLVPNKTFGKRKRNRTLWHTISLDRFVVGANSKSRSLGALLGSLGALEPEGRVVLFFGVVTKRMISLCL